MADTRATAVSMRVGLLLNRGLSDSRVRCVGVGFLLVLFVLAISVVGV